MSPYQGLDDETRKICLYANESTWMTSSSNHGKLDSNFAKTSD
jgi:hypothetical protein